MKTLSINNLKVTHKDGKEIVHGVSLAVKSGELHIIMGPNGSGKSTLLSAFFGHPAYNISGGTITLDGENITNLSTEKRAEKGLFLSMQYPPEIAGVTVISFLHRAYRNLKHRASIRRVSIDGTRRDSAESTARCDSAESEVSVLDFYRTLEEKLKKINIDPALLKRFVNVGFSGGEKKQSEIVQLIALAPHFAFLDEIDSGVDVDALGKVFAGIKMLRTEGTAFVVVTHHGAILEHMKPDVVHVMKEGSIVRTGGAELAREILIKGFEGVE